MPGIPESCQVLYLSPVAMRALASQRIAGGTRISVPAGGDGYVLMTEDPQVIHSLRQRVAYDGPKTVQQERDLVVQRAQMFVDTGKRLVQLGYNADLVTREFATINQQLAQLEPLQMSGQVEKSHELAAVVMQRLDAAIAEQRRAIAGPVALASNPLAVSYRYVFGVRRDAAGARFDEPQRKPAGGRRL